MTDHNSNVEQELAEFIQGPAAEAVANNMKRYTALRESSTPSGGRARVDIIVPDGGGTPLASVVRNGDGTLTHRYGGKPFVPPTIHTMTPINSSVVGDIRASIQSDLVLYAYRNGFKRALRRNPCMIDMPDLTRALHHACDKIVEQNIEGHETVTHGREGQRTRRELKPIHLLAESNTAIKRTVLREQDFQSMLEMAGQQTNSVVAYNTCIANRAVLEELRSAAPNALWYWQKFVARETFRQAERDGVATILYRHFGDLIEVVRSHCGLTGAAWRAFLAAPVEPLDDLVRWSPHHVRTTFQAIGGANRPDANIIMVANACRAVAHPRMWERREDRVFEDGKTPWDKWMAALSQYLNQPCDQIAQTLDGQRPQFINYVLRRTENENASRTLNNVADAILFHAQYLMPWGPGSWDTLVQRTERWHNEREGFLARVREQDAERYRIEQEKRAQATWESLVPPYRDQNITVRPITSGRDMIDLGMRMGNCLSSGRFTDESVNNTGRVFAIEHDDAIIGAVELHNSPSGWRLGQVEGPGNSGKTSDLRRVAKDLRKRYQEASLKLAATAA